MPIRIIGLQNVCCELDESLNLGCVIVIKLAEIQSEKERVFYNDKKNVMRINL